MSFGLKELPEIKANFRVLSSSESSSSEESSDKNNSAENQKPAPAKSKPNQPSDKNTKATIKNKK